MANLRGICRVVFLGALLGFPLGAKAEAEPVALGIGEQKSYPVETGTRFSVGNSEVIQVKITRLSDGGALLFVKGKSQGYSDLILLGDRAVRRSIGFRVLTKKQRAVGDESQRLFQVSPTLKFQPQGNGWLLRGEARSVDEWNLAKAVAAQGNGKVQSLLRLHPLERLKAEKRIAERLRRAGLAWVEVKGVGDTIVLRGEMGSVKEKELAEALAFEVFREARSHLTVPFEAGKTVRFQAKIVELMHSSAQSLGLKWSDGVPAAIEISKFFTKAQFGWSAAFQALERRGHARVLAEPQLLLNEKGVAELRVGGEIPIPLSTRAHSTVQWKPYGLSLRLELPGLLRKSARAKILVELSSLDPANGQEGIPGIRASRMETMVDLRLGRPVMLSGLMESRQSRNLSLLPGLGDIPVIGELFRSRDFQENRSELVIIIEAKEDGA